MTPQPLLRRKPDLLLAVTTLLALLLPPTLALQLWVLDAAGDATVMTDRPPRALIQVALGTGSATDSAASGLPVAGHLGGSIQRQL